MSGFWEFLKGEGSLMPKEVSGQMDTLMVIPLPFKCPITQNSLKSLQFTH